MTDLGTTDFPATAYDSMLPVHFWPPLLNPTASGLYGATNWIQDGDGAPRFTPSGVQIRQTGNYGGEGQFGIWGAPWCGVIWTIEITGDDPSGSFAVTVDQDNADGGTQFAISWGDDAGDVHSTLLSNGFTDVTVRHPDSKIYVLTFPTWHTLDVDGTSLDDATVAAAPEQKMGVRPDENDPFGVLTVWAYDSCDLLPESIADTNQRVQQIMRLEEQVAVERSFAARLLNDAGDLPGDPATAASLRQAVGYLEGQAALTNTTAFFHVGAQWVSQDDGNNLFTRAGARFVSPLGNVWIVGGGYVDGLDDHIVATSQPFGWRTDVALLESLDQYRNIHCAVAERSVCIGYESVVTAVQITG